MKNLLLLASLLFAFNSLAVTVDCTTKLTRGRTNNPNPEETWCGPVKMTIADNGVKYRRNTQNCKNIQVELFSIKSTDDPKFVTNCEKIYRRDCYMIGITDSTNREGLGYLSAHTIFESVNAIPDTFNVSAQANGLNRGLPQPGIRSWLDLNCRVRH